MFRQEIGRIGQHERAHLAEERIVLRLREAVGAAIVHVQIAEKPLLMCRLQQATAELPGPTCRKRLPARWSTDWGREELEIHRAEAALDEIVPP